MKLTEKGIDLMKEFEGLRLEAYQDSVGVWTIGYGNTYYEDGTRVRPGDKITRERALSLYTNVKDEFAENVRKEITHQISDNRFSALVSLAYNIGMHAFKHSTILKKVNENPCDPTIPDEFLRWNKAGGRVLRGLTRRRQAEADLYLNG